MLHFVFVFLGPLGNFFDQEFPQLTSPTEEKGQMSKRADENRDAQHGPVLDPKHQGV